MVWRVEHFAQVDSTNTWLAERARGGADEGLVALADYQSSGRGRLGRTWEASPGGSLLCSVLLRPDLDPSQMQLAVAAVALSLRAAIVRLSGVRPRLKWPNDLLIEDRKLAGVLAEIVQSERGRAVVVGFGVNLTSHPTQSAINLREASGVTIDPRGLLDIVLEEIEPRRAQLESADGRGALLGEYRGALATLGRTVSVDMGERVHVGLAERVDDAGRLVVRTNGVEMTFDTGDVVHVAMAGGDGA